MSDPIPDNGNEIRNLQPDPTRKKSRFWGNAGILFSGIATACLVVVILLTSYGLLVVNSRFASSLTGLTQRFDQAENTITDAEKNATNAEKLAQETSEILKAQTQQIADMQKNQRTNRDDLLIAETFYTVRMASDSLQYENNIPVAIKLLQAANQHFAKLTDTKLYAVREALAADLAALQGAPQVDVTGLYVQLSALDKQMDKLPLMTQSLNKPPQTAINSNDLIRPWWRRGLNSLQEALERIVIIRKNVPDAPPFIAPDQQVFFYQNLHLEMEKAQWGLLHRQPVIYRGSLLQIINWIKQYAAADSSITKQMLQELAKLQQIDVHPAVPALSVSLQALQNVMDNAGK